MYWFVVPIEEVAASHIADEGVLMNEFATIELIKSNPFALIALAEGA